MAALNLVCRALCSWRPTSLGRSSPGRRQPTSSCRCSLELPPHQPFTPSISWAVKAFALLASSSCAPVGLAVGSCARSLPAAEWTGATMRSGSCWVGRPTKALGFWSCSAFRFAGSWGGGVRVTKMATRGSGSAHTTATYTTARETLEPTLTNVV